MNVFNAESFLEDCSPIKFDRSIKISQKFGSILLGIDAKTYKFNLSQKFDCGKLDIKGDEKSNSFNFSPNIDDNITYNLGIENNGVFTIKSDLSKKIHYKDGVFTISGRYTPSNQSVSLSYSDSTPNIDYKIYYDKDISADVSIKYPYFVYDGSFTISSGTHNVYLQYKHFRLGGRHFNDSTNGFYAGFIHDNCQLVARFWPNPILFTEAKYKKAAAHVEVSGKDDIAATCNYTIKDKTKLIAQVSSKNWRAPIFGFSSEAFKSFVQYTDKLNYSFEINIEKFT